MTKRMTVVLSQAPTRSAAREDLEQELVASLLMDEGLEVTVVPHLQQLEPDDTGLLCLAGIAGDMILLSWLNPLEAHSILTSHNIQGRLGRTRQSQHVATDQSGSPRRTVYCIDLSTHDDAQSVREEIHRVRDEAQVETFDLLDFAPGSINVMAPAPSAEAGAAEEGASQSAAATGARDALSHSEGKSAALSSADKLPTVASAEDGTTEYGCEDDREDAELDALIDRLDEFDL